MKELKVSEKFLNQIVDYASRALVGKILKRVEISTDKETLKSYIKEVVYENYRDLLVFIKSFSEGLNFYRVEFTNKEEKEPDK